MKAPWKKKFHFYSLWQEIIFTVVNGLTQNQSLTFSKLKLNKKRKSKRLMHLLKIKCTNMIINGVTYMNLIYSGLLLSTCKKIIYTQETYIRNSCIYNYI